MTILALIVLCIVSLILEFIDYMFSYFYFISSVKRFNMYASSLNIPVIDIPGSLRGKIRLWRRYGEFLKFVHYQEFSLHINGGVDPDEF